MAHRYPSRAALALTALLGLLAAALSLPGCEGSATQTTNGQGLSGILVDPQGKPAAGAMVAAWRAGGLSPIGQGNIPVAMTRTDGQGHYALDLETGTYNLFAHSGQGSLTVGMPGVVYAAVNLDLGVRTMMPPGSVSGTVLAGGAPAQELFCFIPGSAFVAMTDASGRFSLGQVPPGTYLMRYVKSGYLAAEESVTVVSDSAISLPDRDMSLDISLQPPAPTGLTASVDSISGYVALRWGAVRAADLNGYVVDIRLEGDTSMMSRRIEGPMPDTVFVDSGAVWRFQQFADQVIGTGPVDSCLIEYRVKAVDKDGNSSPVYAIASLVLQRPALERTEVRLAGLDGLGDSARCLDTLAVAASFTNPVFDMAGFEWRVEARFPHNSYSYLLYPVLSNGIWTKKPSADTLRWYWGKGMSPEEMEIFEGFGEPDSLSFKVNIRFEDGFSYTNREKIIVLVRTAPGCYFARPDREPRYKE